MRSFAARVMYKLYLYCVVRVASLYRTEYLQITCSFSGNVSAENVSLRKTTSVDQRSRSRKGFVGFLC